MITQTQINNIPNQLKQLRQWVCHKDKIPVTPGTGEAASHSDSSTWRTFNEALQNAAKYDGIGFVFSKNDPYVGVDIDHCIDKNNALSDNAKKIVNTIMSYTEKSQSGKGIHVICKGILPPGARRNRENGVEMYSENRFFVVTGNKLSKNSTIADRVNEVNDIYYQFVANNSKQRSNLKPQPLNPTHSKLTYKDIIARLPKKKKEKFLSLWEGDLAEYNNDHSSADLALCSILAHYTKSPEMTDELFRQSELYREKWDEIHYGDGRTYGQVTIEKALQNLHEETPWFDEKGRFKAPRLAQHLLESSSYIFHNQDFYHYESGVYRTISELTIKKKCREILGDEYNSRSANEVLHNMKISLSSSNDFSCDITKINLLNGLFDWQKSELLPHSSGYVSRIQLPVEYDENAICPAIDKFFSDVCPR
jgi:putative DNA primase/helicase